jgi:hypothetical protein
MDKEKTRLLRFLAGGAVAISDSARAESLLLDGGDRGVLACTRALLDALQAEGTVRVDKRSARLSTQGVRDAATARPIAASAPPARDIEMQVVDTDEGARVVAVNRAESPLAQLMRLRTRDGKPFLDKAEHEAGERLRSDYTRGQIMPRMGANWQASVSSGRRAAGVADLTDAALGARQRVDRAIAAVGPELAGILIDVCCFLKGMETVEAERGWPVRSAKIMLKTALGVLARHYEPRGAQSANGPRRMLHWGTADFRPSIR